MSLQTLLGLASSKAVAAVAGVTLTAGGAAGIVVASEHAPDPDTTVVVEQLEGEVAPADEHDADGPAEEAADVAHEIHQFLAETDLTGCAFGLGVAAIASGEKAPAADDVCDREGAEDELESTSEQGEDASTARADNADRAEEHLGDAAEEAPGDARVPEDVPAGSADSADDTPRGGPETGDEARGDAGPPSDG